MKLSEALCLIACMSVTALLVFRSDILNFHSTSTMPFGRGPLDQASNPYWQEHINRDRIYDFYA